VTARHTIWLLALSATAVFAAEPPTRSVSTSKQFIVYSDDAKVRSEALIRAEDLKREFLEFLRLKDEWKMPIILKFGPPPNVKRPPRFHIGIFEGDSGGNKIQIDIYDPKLSNDPELDAQVIAALTLEYTYRDTPVKAGRSFATPPVWFVEGLSERAQTTDGAIPSGIYGSLLAGDTPPKVTDVLDTRPARLDPTSRAIYRAQSAALLAAIAELPDGRPGLRVYLAKPRRGTDVNELLGCLPSLGNKREALARKWLLVMARLSATKRSNLMTERETARELDTVLAVKPLPDPKRPEVAAMSGPYALPTIAKSQNGKFILAQLEGNLLRVSTRAHPLHKPIAEEYLRIVRELQRKPKKRVDKRIAAAEEMRAALNRQTGEVRDYMDWVETTKIKTQNTEMQRALDELEELEQPAPRTDAISRYLDAAAERDY
jgi:hypothetical protein